jgi:hypothetical protein
MADMALCLKDYTTKLNRIKTANKSFCLINPYLMLNKTKVLIYNQLPQLKISSMTHLGVLVSYKTG